MALYLSSAETSFSELFPNEVILEETSEDKVYNDKIYNDKAYEKNYHMIAWSPDHETIMIDWADKAICYKWMHQRAHAIYSNKNTMFTIPVIIMSTLTGTANFAQDRIPADYLNMATMIIGAINLFAGILTTIQQYLKISELNESHRVSAISWGKFYRNIKTEICKSPLERSPVNATLKHSKEEFDRLTETSPSIPTYIVDMFIKDFSGGQPQLDEHGNEINLTRKQKIFSDLKKPDICGEIETTANYLYIRKDTRPYINPAVSLARLQKKKLECKKNSIEDFIKTFQEQRKRIPTKDEILDNLDNDSIQMELIESVYSDLTAKNILTIASEISSDEIV
jgi:hypothetical protein